MQLIEDHRLLAVDSAEDHAVDLARSVHQQRDPQRRQIAYESEINVGQKTSATRDVIAACIVAQDNESPAGIDVGDGIPLHGGPQRQ
jgi:hypothetical protein